MTLVLTLQPPDLRPTLEDVEAALDRPARPLFIGRKSCLPACRLVGGWLEADNALAALVAAPPSEEIISPMRAVWPLAH